MCVCLCVSTSLCTLVATIGGVQRGAFASSPRKTRVDGGKGEAEAAAAASVERSAQLVDELARELAWWTH